MQDARSEGREEQRSERTVEAVGGGRRGARSWRCRHCRRGQEARAGELCQGRGGGRGCEEWVHPESPQGREPARGSQRQQQRLLGGKGVGKEREREQDQRLHRQPREQRGVEAAGLECGAELRRGVDHGALSSLDYNYINILLSTF